MAYIINSLKLSVICIFLMVAATSCMIGEDTKKEPGYIDVTIVLPESPREEIEARHGILEPPTADESKINTLTFFVFRGDNNAFEQYRMIVIRPDGTSVDPMWDQSKKTLRMVLTLGPKKIYAIANWDEPATAEMPKLSEIRTITDLMKAVRRHNSMPSGVAPVMSGTETVTLNGGEQDLKIKMKRQIARVDVYPAILDLLALGANPFPQISVEGIRFINMAKETYIFTQTPAASPNTLVWDQVDYVLASSGNLTTAAPAQPYATFYIPEYFGKADLPTTMLIKARYEGRDTYYSIPLNGHAGALPALYAVERNHIYAYYVTIEGEGAASDSSSDLGQAGVKNVKYITEIR